MKWFLAALVALLSSAGLRAEEPVECTLQTLGKALAGAVPPGLSPPAEAGGAEVTYTCISMRGASGTGFKAIWEASWNGGQQKRVFGASGWGIPLIRR